MKAEISTHYKSRNPSAIRLAPIAFSKRTDKVTAVNAAIGNVSLSMHPALQERMRNLLSKDSPFRDGVVKYSSSKGLEETNQAFLNIIGSSGFETKNLHVLVTDGGSQAMELAILGTCGEAGSKKRPLLVIDPAYANYRSMAERIGRAAVSVSRNLQDNGNFSLPDFAEIEKTIRQYQPGALLIIPYDNPTGQFYNQQTINDFAKLCIKYNLWLISDEAYRELFYVAEKTSSIWGITEKDVPGITGRRISIESASKVWNACGLRIGALITDNLEFNEKAVAENTANLCSPVIAQYVFGALANVNHQDLKTWYEKQRNYYKKILTDLRKDFEKLAPSIIVSRPEASLYVVVDVRKVVKPDFDSERFVMYCATQGKVGIDGKETTLLVSPMNGFYETGGEKSPGKTQMRISCVETPENMALIPFLFTELLKQYENQG